MDHDAQASHGPDTGDSDFPGDAPGHLEVPLRGPASPYKSTAKISLREMADDAHRELTRRHRVYAGMAKHGTMSEAEAAAGIAVARAIRNTLRLFAGHEDAVRETIVREIAAQKLKDHPAVAAVRDAFPDAELTAVRPLYRHTGDAA